MKQAVYQRLTAGLAALLLLLFAAGCGKSAPAVKPEDPGQTVLTGDTGTPAQTPEQAVEIATQKAGQTALTAQQEVGRIPAYTGAPYHLINENRPAFTGEEKTTVSFETYSPPDPLGRCGVCTACIGRDIMPTEKRGEIGQVKPTGWHTVKYDWVDGKYLYNRCHLIGYQLTGENANAANLITGTRYLNVEGMLPFENMVADYVKETGNHVLYRVTPVFIGEDLVAAGVVMEGYSVEDNGDGICFCVYCYNVQPGVIIDYATGDSRPAEDALRTDAPAASGTGEPSAPPDKADETVYVARTGKTYHRDATCSKMKDPRSMTYSRAVDAGYKKCTKCW